MKNEDLNALAVNALQVWNATGGPSRWLAAPDLMQLARDGSRLLAWPIANGECFDIFGAHHAGNLEQVLLGRVYRFSRLSRIGLGNSRAGQRSAKVCR
jgi:hypothetical protein